MDNIRVIVVDDHPLFREGVVKTLAAESDIEVIAEGSNAEDALKQTRDLLPDVILLDINMKGGGIEAARVIAAECPVTKIIMLTVSENEEDVHTALKVGARAFVLKGVTARKLIRIVRDIHAGRSYVPSSLAASLLVDPGSKDSNDRQDSDIFDELTDRERQILELLATGLKNREIADKLYLSEKTVKHYMTNILQKLHVRNRVEAAVLARKITKDKGG